MKHFRIQIHLILFLIIVTTNINAQQKSWINTGGPYKGHAAAIASGPDGLVMTVTNSGMFRSTDYGITWKSIYADVWVDHIKDYLFLYAQLTISNGTVFLTNNDTLSYRSTDYGNTWTSIQPSDVHTMRSITSNSPNDIFAIANDTTILHSIDNGDHWTEISDTLNIDYIYSIAINPDGLLFLSSGNKVFRSSDGGSSWEQICDWFMSVFTFTPDGTIFATPEGVVVHEAKIYKSTNNGDSWSISYAFPGGGLRYYYFRGLSSDLNGNVYYGERYHAYYLKNNDTTWHSFGFSVESRDEWISAISIGKSNYIYVDLINKGLFRTDDPVNWTNISQSLATTPLHQISVAPNGTIYAATDSGLTKSTNDGITWKLGHRPPAYLVNTNSKNDVFVGIEYQGISRSTDGGDSWTNIATVQNIGIDMKDKLYNKDHDSIRTSIDNGDTWVSVDSTWIYPSCYAFGGNNIFIGQDIYSSDYIIYGSQDGGNTWKILTQGLPSFPHYPLTLHSLAADNNGNVYAAIDSGLYRSTNSGNYWNLIGQSLPKSQRFWNDQIVYYGPDIKSAILVNDTLYVGYDRGVFYSTDQGDTWTALNEGLSSIYPDVIYLTKRPDGYLYLATSSGTVFRYSDPITSVDNKNKFSPSTWKLEQNYPNPFNPSTKIKYTIPNVGTSFMKFVRLTVYDVLGKEIATLVNKVKPAGNYEVEFNGSNLSSGVYFYKLQAGDITTTKKMLLLK